jgi:DNA-binding protein HU-beta
MRRKQLLENIRRALGGTATQSAAELALNAVTRAIRDGMREDEEVKIAKFGTFRLKHVAARRLLLPKTGQSLTVPPRKVLRFIPAPRKAPNFPV